MHRHPSNGVIPPMRQTDKTPINPDRPLAIIVAGPNGAGKSTTSRFLLSPRLNIYINPDLIATGLSPSHPESVSFAAGRIVLSQIRELIAARQNFAFETTLSGKTYINIISALKAADYQVHLIFLWLESADLAVNRVRERVRSGGHNIPEETIRRRYSAGLRNFFQRYEDLVDRWSFFDNTSSNLKLLATEKGVSANAPDADLWEQITSQYGRII